MFLFNLVAFSFQWFDYDVSMHVCFGLLLEFILFVLSVWLMLLFLKNLSSSIIPSALFSLSGTSITCTLDGLFLSRNSRMLCLGVCFLFLLSFYNFYFIFVSSLCFLIFKLLDSFLKCVHSNNEPAKNFHLLRFLFQAFPFIFIISNSLLTFLVRQFMLFTISTISLNVLQEFD